jgi:hypothetical protein
MQDKISGWLEWKETKIYKAATTLSPTIPFSSAGHSSHPDHSMRDTADLLLQSMPRVRSTATESWFFQDLLCLGCLNTEDIVLAQYFYSAHIFWPVWLLPNSFQSSSVLADNGRSRDLTLGHDQEDTQCKSVAALQRQRTKTSSSLFALVALRLLCPIGQI